MSEQLPRVDRRKAREKLVEEIKTVEAALEQEHPELFGSQRKMEKAKASLASLLQKLETLPDARMEAMGSVGKEAGAWAFDTALLKIPSTLTKLSTLLGGSYGYSQLGKEAPSLERIMDAAEELYRVSKLSVGDQEIVDAEAETVQAEYEHKMLLVKGDPEEVLEYHKKFGALVEKRSRLEKV